MTALWRTLRLVSVSCKIKQISTLMFEQWDWSRGAGEAVVIVRTLGLFLPAPTPALIHANPVTGDQARAGGVSINFPGTREAEGGVWSVVSTDPSTAATRAPQRTGKDTTIFR